MSAAQLLPCPFCGGRVALHHPTDPRTMGVTFVLCDACGAVASFRPNRTGSEAISAWNRRAAGVYELTMVSAVSRANDTRYGTFSSYEQAEAVAKLLLASDSESQPEWGAYGIASAGRA